MFCSEFDKIFRISLPTFEYNKYCWMVNIVNTRVVHASQWIVRIFEWRPQHVGIARNKISSYDLQQLTRNLAKYDTYEAHTWQCLVN